MFVYVGKHEFYLDECFEPKKKKNSVGLQQVSTTTYIDNKNFNFIIENIIITYKWCMALIKFIIFISLFILKSCALDSCGQISQISSPVEKKVD